MDVSPRALRAVTFRVAFRGYNVDDVDQFLDRVAEGVAALQAKLDDALARTEQAESDRAAATEGEDAVQRTLKLAQRTADLALKEAKEEAARLVADARETADRLAEEAQRQLRSDLERLETARKHLHDDVLAMQQYVEHERVRIRDVLADLVRKVDSTTRRPPAPPTATKLDIPAVGERRIVADAPEPTTPEPTAPLEPPEPPVAPDAVESVEPPEADEPEPAAPEPVDVTPVEDAPPPPRREPQPPPMSGPPFGAARPASGPPAGPPPGPRRMAASIDATRALDAIEANVDTVDDNGAEIPT
ncbi:MAG TPA: DivIVA domain-containing protein [Acidimicrobiales bacterium]|nr:DivIVA domain-containing protein [Acidimicrobiales bacterium]